MSDDTPTQSIAVSRGAGAAALEAHIAERKAHLAEAMTPEEAAPMSDRGTLAHAIRLARGSTDYGGGHRGEQLEAFQHGIATVVTVLERAAANLADGRDDDYLLRVVEGIGAGLLLPAPEHRLGFSVWGEPVGTQRPRFDPRSKRTYKDGKMASYLGVVIYAARAALAEAPGWPCTGETLYLVRLRIEVARPAGGTGPSFLSKCVPANGKPDVDNVAKLILDGMADAGVYPGDSLVFRLEVERYWAPIGDERSRVHVLVEAWPRATLQRNEKWHQRARERKERETP